MLTISFNDLKTTEYTTANGTEVVRVQVKLDESRSKTQEESANPSGNESPSLERSRVVYFEVRKADADLLCTDRIDAFIVVSLYWAMSKSQNGERVRITSPHPISEQLLFSLTQTVVPTVSTELKDRYGSVDFDIPVTHTLFGPNRSSGAGITGGVDSTYTLLKVGSLPDSLNNIKPDVGVTIDVDATSFDSLTPQSLQHLDLAREICERHDLRHAIIESNLLDELYGFPHAAVIDSLIMGYALSLQKGLSHYYMGSGWPFNKFSFYGPDNSAYELFNSKYYSTENLSIYSIGSEVSRLEKIRFIAQFDEPKHYLHPCSATNTRDNCNRCSKCTRTMVALWAMDKLDDFSDVFDVESFYKDPNYHFGYLVMRRDSPFNKEVIELCSDNGHPLPKSAWTAAFKKWAKRGFHATNPLAEGFRPKE